MEKPFNMNFYNKRSIATRMEYFRIKYPKSFDKKTCDMVSEMLQRAKMDYNLFMMESFDSLVSEEKAKKYIDNIKEKYGIKEKVTLEEAKENLDLKDVFEFEQNGVNYIRMELNDGSHKIIENNTTRSSAELFNDLNNEMMKIKAEGNFTSEEIFERLLNRHKEINLENEVSIEKDKKSAEANIYLDIIKKEFPDKKIEAAAEENMFIINDGEFFLKVEGKDGNYILKNIDGTVYKSNDEKIEVSNNIEDNYIKEEIMEPDFTNEKFVETVSENIDNLLGQDYDEKRIFDELKSTYNISSQVDIYTLQEIILNRSNEKHIENNNKSQANSSVMKLGIHPSLQQNKAA
jgi:hypothetical protein